MIADLRLQIDGFDDSPELSDLLRAFEGLAFDQGLLNALTKVGFEAAKGDAAMTEELRRVSVNFYAKLADLADDEDARGVKT